MKEYKNRSLLITVALSLLLLMVSATPANAITGGGKCNGSTGNSLVMKNGKIHGGMAGNNKSYVGPLYLCEGGKWTWWSSAKPEKKAPVIKDNPSVKPGFSCTQIGKIVNTNSYGKLQCKYFRVGRIQGLRWS